MRRKIYSGLGRYCRKGHVRLVWTRLYFLTPLSEIPAIRQSQDFISQQHVNLTTIATFLSSVTATTLQISASAPASVLTSVTNTFWFVSLVFSAASAVYSLLEMTWRRSPMYVLCYLSTFWLTGSLAVDRTNHCRLQFMLGFVMGLCSLS